MKKIITACVCMAALLACQDIQSQKEMLETTKSGFKYSISQDIEGPTPQIGQFCMVHTVMMYGDSVLSDTREYPGRPTLVSMDPEEKRRGSASGPVQDLLEKMSVGDKALLHYPLDSFKTKPQRLAHMDEVVYDIELVQIMKNEQEVKNYYAAERLKMEEARNSLKEEETEMGGMMQEFYQTMKSDPSSQKWQVTKSGLKYIMLKDSGTGIKIPDGEYVRTHYYGLLAEDGKAFDNSYQRGSTFDFTVGEDPVNDGWKEAMSLLEKGDKAIIYVPSELGYGKQGFPGFIPPDADLIFYMEIVGVGEEE